MAIILDFPRTTWGLNLCLGSLPELVELIAREPGGGREQGERQELRAQNISVQGESYSSRFLSWERRGGKEHASSVLALLRTTRENGI